MTKATYSELLRDPRWQKMRLKKLESAEWKCERCGDIETTLNVHHKRYVKGRMPWEYSEAELSVLCQPCHAEEHDASDIRSELLARLWSDGPLGIEDFFAYGAGAISRFDWLLDEPLALLLNQLKASKPLQFNSGRLASEIAELWMGSRTFAVADLERLSARVRSNGDFAFDLLRLVQQYGDLQGDKEAS